MILNECAVPTGCVSLNHTTRVPDLQRKISFPIVKSWLSLRQVSLAGPSPLLSGNQGRLLYPVPLLRRRYGSCISLRASKAVPYSFSIGASCLQRSRPKALQISAFKGSAQNSEAGGRASGSQGAKNSVKLKECESALTEPPNSNDMSLSCTSEVNSSTIHSLFRKFLTNLRTHSSDEVLEDESSPISDTEVVAENKDKNLALKAVLYQFLALDATIKIPLLIFLPAYLAVNVMYGPEVSKELTPLWVLGPVLVAFYIKVIQWLASLYVFTFKQTINIIKNLPTYSSVAYSYLVQGKLKAALYARLVQPLVDIRNLNHKEFLISKLKELLAWAMEWYLDFVESIWPYYCRAIRFLKRANLI